LRLCLTRHTGPREASGRGEAHPYLLPLGGRWEVCAASFSRSREKVPNPSPAATGEADEGPGGVRLFLLPLQVTRCRAEGEADEGAYFKVPSPALTS